MSNFIDLIKRYYKLLTSHNHFICQHKNVKTINIEDKHFDYMTDNDDLDDIPTIVEIRYCVDCGKILDKHYIYDIYPFVSTWDEIRDFKRICNIRHEEDFSLYNEIAYGDNYSNNYNHRK